MLCTHCKSEESIHEDNNQALCEKCMKELELVWNRDSYEFISEYAICPDCGGEMEWCDCCQTYSQNCCIEYGTCLCS